MKTVIIRCPKCKSKNIVARRDVTSWCRRCGFEGGTAEFEDAPKLDRLERKAQKQ